MDRRLLLASLAVPTLAGLGAFASSDRPDGLESTARDLGFAATARPQPALMPDYNLPGLPGGSGSLVAGLLGATACLALAAATAWLARRPTRP